ncbi:MAG: hypothetical protein HY591_02535 [Candidatus Omnitrophica bacterium]|nr:hypothetical protein [Candidatus Omnitrophota bacterium]
MERLVYIVHAIDTEGPLYESIEATFERLNTIFGCDLGPSYENLEKIRNKQIDLNGNEESAKDIFSKERGHCHATWDQIDEMLDVITSDDFRCGVKDSFGGGWVYNWFCLDHAGISGLNPRRRDMGYHNVQDHYRDYVQRKKDGRDLIQWHYHALSITNDAHRAGSTYLNSDHIYNILTRKIIDRNWFPASFRPGHHTERPDAHFFLEQWIPFDYGNDSADRKKSGPDISQARYGDWRRAPRSWIPYHPAHDDYQAVGNCRRYIARCLPIDERSYQISQKDVMQAFDEAEKKGAAILSFTGHDFRDMKPGVESMRQLIRKCSEQNKGIKYKYANAIEAMRGVLGVDAGDEIGFNVQIKKFKTHSRLMVESGNNIFGPQPFLALKTKGNGYYWQNFDFEGHNTWSYSFDSGNIWIDQISNIGIAANNNSGLTEVVNIDVDNKQHKKYVLNR